MLSARETKVRRPSKSRRSEGATTGGKRAVPGTMDTSEGFGQRSRGSTFAPRWPGSASSEAKEFRRGQSWGVWSRGHRVQSKLRFSRASSGPLATKKGQVFLSSRALPGAHNGHPKLRFALVAYVRTHWQSPEEHAAEIVESRHGLVRRALPGQAQLRVCSAGALVAP